MTVLEVQVSNERQVLVVAGDYDVVQKVRSALSGRGFRVQSAYSHRDAAYALRRNKHDLVLVDIAMRDRRSGAPTLPMLAQQGLHPPIVALALDGTTYDETAIPADTLITTLDELSIQRGVMHALRMPALQLIEPSTPDDLAEGHKRVEEIQTLFSLSRSLTEVLNLSEVLNRVVEAARRLTNAEEGMILLPDSESGQLWLRAKVGIDVEVARNFRVQTQDTLAGAVFKSGKPLVIGERGPQKVKTEYFVNALLYVPILLRGKPIGVLGVMNKYKHDIFDARHQELLVNLASYAAIAIENARIHEESVKQARELKALVDASQIVNSSITLDRTLPNVCEQLIAVLNVSRSAILDLDRERDALRMVARCDRAIWHSGSEPRIDLTNRPAIRHALETNRYFMVMRRRRLATGELQTLDQVGASAMLFFPIQTTSGIAGAAFAYYIRPPVQEPTAEAVENAQRQALLCLAQTGELQGRGTAAVFRQAEELIRILGADWCECAIFGPDKESLALRLVYGSGLWLSDPYPMLPLSDYPDLRAALDHCGAINYQMGSNDMPEGAKPLLEATRSKSVLGVPLVSRGQANGMALFADSERLAPFSPREVDLARAMVGQAATALENAHLFHSLEASLRELRDTQGRLIQAARLSAMGELAAAVAHQVNNPLTTIVLDTELMLLSEPADSSRHEALEAIVRAGKRAASVVRRLLTTARPSDADARLEPVDVVATVEDVVALVKGHIERDRVRLHETLPTEELPLVMAPVGQLDDVWLNLLLNAHDALHGCEGAEMGIEVNYKPNGDTVDVVVWDNGPGIPEAIVDEIFKPFFTTKPIGEGTGLGLHICRQVVERAGGRIEVKTAPHEGTRFLVQLPVKRGE